MLQEYATALRYIRALLQLEPGNRQAQASTFLILSFFLLSKIITSCILIKCPCKQELESLVTKRMEFEGMVGMAVTGGAIMIN